MQKGRTRISVIIAFISLTLCGSVWGLNNPIAKWTFDENGGTIAYDSAGSNNGTLQGGAGWTSGVSGSALSLDGVNGYVNVPDNPSLRFSQSSSFTIVFWAKPVSDGGIICKMRSSGTGVFGYNIAWGHQMQSFTFDAESSHICGMGIDTGTNSAVAGSWYHVAAVYNNKAMKMYVNGVLKGSNIFTYNTGTTTPTKNLAIGAFSYDSTIGTFYGGALDEMRIYNVALSANEIKQIYQQKLPPVTYNVDGVSGNNGNNGLSKETAFKTIQKGIDAAADGDIVFVWPGVYTEQINFLGKAITVKSAADAAILEAPGDFAASFYTAEDANSVLQNFVIRNCDAGVFIVNASPTIKNLTVINNGFGIESDGGGNPDISNCIFYNNTDGGLYQCNARCSYVEGQAEDGLAAYWKLDGDATDSAGANNGSIYGAAPAIGQVGGALNFDGVNDYVDVPDNPSLRFSQSSSFTIAFWAKPVSTGTILCKRCSSGSGVFGYEVYTSFDDGSFNFEIESSKIGETWVSTKPVITGNWYYIAAVYDNKNMKIYLNGVLKGSGIFAYDTGSTTPDKNLAIGAESFESYLWCYFGGALDDMRIYDRALGDEEIVQAYKAGLAGRYYGEPMFADSNGGDYHLLSERGRYWPAQNVWVLDSVTSPCVDGGDPNDNPKGEPMPNGGRIDMGAYGGTAYASMSEWRIKGDVNRDGIFNFADFAILAGQWMEKEAWWKN